LSISELRDEYNKILDFLTEEIKIHLTNIINHHTKHFQSYLEPVLIDGILTFKSIYGGHFVEDFRDKKIVEIANIDLSNEMNALTVSYFTFNQFIDRWDRATGEVLRERIDIQEKLKAINLLAENDIPNNLITIRRFADTIAEITRFNEEHPFLFHDLTNIDGGVFDLSFLHGKYVLVNFTTSWYPGFPREQYNLQRLYDDYGNDDFTILVIFLGEEPETVKSFVISNNYTFQVAINQNNSLRVIYSSHVPTSYLIDKYGNIVLKINNEKDWMDNNVLRMLMNNIPTLKKSTVKDASGDW
jgi:glutathione peroxidase-family protein